ncbi:MAG: SGNH/GDSL hydrolase family protein [Phycisphaeraceae bacterium]
MLQPNDLILFQGDSITDAGRARNDLQRNGDLGRGYAAMTAALLLADHPTLNLGFLNRGISGDRVTNLMARWKGDCLNLQPTVVSILIGVNDIWHEFGSKTGTNMDKYERFYRELLVDARAALPQVRLVLCEPFVTRTGAVGDDWLPVLKEEQAIVRKLANEFAAKLVPFQGMFDQACQEAPANYWAGDGVHPSAAGHMRMARMWIESMEM